MTQPTVLVAEDDFIVAFDLCHTVKEAGYSVEGPYTDVSSAMEAFRKHKPDLAILDVHLGNETAYSFAEELIADDVPVIFHSGVSSPDEVSKRFPDAETLAKPCPPNKVIDKLSNALAA